MSVENNAFRTIDGVNEILTDRINIVEALELNGDDGLANQFVKVNPDGISQGWGYVGTADLPNNIPLSNLANMPTLTIQKNSVSAGTYNPKTDSDKAINIAVPIETLEATQPLVIQNVGTDFIVALSKDDATIIKNVSNELEVGAVPFSKLTIADGDIGYAKLNLTGEILNADIKNDEIKDAKISSSAAIDITKLAEHKISGISLGNNLADLTAGSHITFSTGTTYNGGTAITINSANDNTLPAAGTNISITGAGNNVVNLDFTSGGDIGFSNLAASPTNIFATNIKPHNLEVANNAVFNSGISLNGGAGGLQSIVDANSIGCNTLAAATHIQSSLIKVGNTRGTEVIMYRTGFFTETEWFGDVFMSGGSNDSFVNSCWFFGNKNEGALTSTNWKIYAIGSGSGKTGGFDTYSHAKNDVVGTGSNAILYSKSGMELSNITKIVLHIIKGTGINGGTAITSNDDLFLIWNDGTNFQTLPTTSSSTTGDYHYKLYDGGGYGGGSWESFNLDLSSVFSAQGLTNFNSANRVAFYATDTNGQYGITNIEFHGINKPVDKKIDNVSHINNLNILNGSDYRASLAFHPIGKFMNGWYYQPLDMSKFYEFTSGNSSMNLYSFTAGGGDPNTFTGNDNNGLVSNGNHNQIYYLFDCPEGYYIEGYYISLISRTSGNHLGMNPSSSLYNHLIQYGEGANAPSRVITEATTNSGAISSGQTQSFCAFNREVATFNRGIAYDNGLSTFNGETEFGYRATLSTFSKKYAIMFYKNPGFSNTSVFRGGYIKYSRV